MHCAQPNLVAYGTDLDGSASCNCPQQCNSKQYLTSISKIPGSQRFVNAVNQAYSSAMLTQLNQSAGMDQAIYKMALFRAEGWQCNDFVLMTNFAGFTVCFSSMQYIDTITNPGYSFLGLLSDIGGALSLILGTTIFALIQIMDSIFGSLLLFIIEKVKKTRIVHVIV